MINKMDGVGILILVSLHEQSWKTALIHSHNDQAKVVGEEATAPSLKTSNKSNVNVTNLDPEIEMLSCVFKT